MSCEIPYVYKIMQGIVRSHPNSFNPNILAMGQVETIHWKYKRLEPDCN
jgi:hypothetical protein